MPGVESLTEEVRKLTRDPYVKKSVVERVQEFLEVNKRDSPTWFTELVYCLLTAYSSAERGQLCMDELNDCGAILSRTREEVVEALRRGGHRFADKRAEYIVAARALATDLKGIIQGFKSSNRAREWLVENVRGIGMKEASHFLRNVGYLDVAILDRHILSNMREYGLIEDSSKGLTRRLYLAYESTLKRVADRLGMPLGVLDLYLWYRKTGKVLK